MLYAIIINKLNIVADIVETKTEPFYPPTSSGLTFCAVPCDENVKINMLYNKNIGEFTEPEPKPEPEPEPKPLSDIEAAILDTSVNTEYLVCLADLGI